jgi:hypothetical protein
MKWKLSAEIRLTAIRERQHRNEVEANWPKKNYFCNSVWNFSYFCNSSWNFRGQFLPTWFAPRDKLCPPRVNTLYCLEEWRDKQRIPPAVDSFTPRGQSSLLGYNFALGGQSLPLGAKLRMKKLRIPTGTARFPKYSSPNNDHFSCITLVVYFSY